MGLKIDLGHMLSIGTMVIGLAVSHGSTSAENARIKQDLVKMSDTQERMTEQLNRLNSMMIRTQTQLEDRQEMQDRKMQGRLPR